MQEFLIAIICLLVGYILRDKFTLVLGKTNFGKTIPGAKYDVCEINGVPTLVAQIAACWNDFVDDIVPVGEVNNKLKKKKTLRALLMSLQSRPELYESLTNTTVYYQYFGINHTDNHIGTTFFEGSSCFLLGEGFDLPSEILGARWYHNVNMPSTISEALFAEVAKDIPRAGGPTKPHKLTEMREKNFRDNIGHITFFRSSSTASVLPVTDSSLVALSDSEVGTLKDYIEAKDSNKMSLGTALMVNVMGIGGKRADRTYFKAIGSPAVQSQSVYYLLPANITNGDLLAGTAPTYNALINTAFSSRATTKLHKIAQMLSTWGYDVWKVVKVKDNAGVLQDKYYCRFMWPGGFSDASVHNDTMQRVRDDLNLIANAMTKAKNDNKGATTSGGRKLLEEIDEKNFQFFGKLGPKAGN